MKTEKAKTSETENVPLSFVTLLIRNFQDSKILHEIPSTHDTSENILIVVQGPHFERFCPQYDQSMCHVSVLYGSFFFLTKLSLSSGFSYGYHPRHITTVSFGGIKIQQMVPGKLWRGKKISRHLHSPNDSFVSIINLLVCKCIDRSNLLIKKKHRC